jgi:hypothetical protein
MDHETVYLTFFGMEEHRPAAATRIINRMIACGNNRWGVDGMVNRGRWNDRESYLRVHGSLLALRPLMGRPVGSLEQHTVCLSLSQLHATVCPKLLIEGKLEAAHPTLAISTCVGDRSGAKPTPTNMGFHRFEKKCGRLRGESRPRANPVGGREADATGEAVRRKILVDNPARLFGFA